MVFPSMGEYLIKFHSMCVCNIFYVKTMPNRMGYMLE